MKPSSKTCVFFAAVALAGCSTVGPIAVSADQRFTLVTDTSAAGPSLKVVDARPDLTAGGLQEIPGGVRLGDAMLDPSPPLAVEHALRTNFKNDRTLSHGTAVLDGKSFRLTKFDVTFTQRDIVAEGTSGGMPGMVAVDAMFRHLARATLGGSTIRVHIVLMAGDREIEAAGETKATSSPGPTFTRIAFDRAIKELARGVYYAALEPDKPTQ